MNKDSTYAFYGSLRRGMKNYYRFEKDLVYLYSIRLKGFKLFSRGVYPCAIRDAEEQSIVVEVFTITNKEVEADIHRMEMVEGYYFEDIPINGKMVGIYLFRSNDNYQEVNGGDWVTFFRRNSI